MLDLTKINKSWTLFLDRDGVINHEKKADYVYNYDEFKFYDGATKALGILTEYFGRIVIVTNQRGVGKGLMSEKDLLEIHEKMLKDIRKSGGKIDLIVYCISLDDSDHNRKPNPGMALQAKATFPDIEFSRSIMVGNNISDMIFGRNAGMYSVLIRTTNPDPTLPHPVVDDCYKDLKEFAEALQQRVRLS